jgi:hypothetical protein
MAEAGAAGTAGTEAVPEGTAGGARAVPAPGEDVEVGGSAVYCM